MGPLARQLLLESVLAPFVFASLVMIAARRDERQMVLAQSFAIIVGAGITYILAFGWPPSLTGGSRTKVMLSLLIGLVIGFGFERRARWARPALIASAIGLPLWVGLPALQLGKSESALLALPILAALSLSAPIGRDQRVLPLVERPWLPMLITMAVGLAAIAAFAKAFTFTQLGLALASVLLACLVVGREPLGPIAACMAAAMLLTTATALLLYSAASPWALLVLGTVLFADRAARLTNRSAASKTTVPRLLIFCFLPAAAAILIARIDAGPFSIY